MTKRLSLCHPFMQFDIRTYDEVTSTNDVVKQLALEGEPEGVVVCASTQTAGYGRRGNTWKSDPGSLYMSLLLRPQSEAAQIQTLPLVTAVAVRRAIASFLPESEGDIVQVKWPNDVVVVPKDDKTSDVLSSFSKICGISSELKHGAICVGIGVNVNTDDADVDTGITVDVGGDAYAQDAARNRPTYMSELLGRDECPAIDQVRDAVLAQFASAYESWQQFGFAPFRDDYMRHFALMGKTVCVEEALASDANGTMRSNDIPCCIVEGVDDEGRLVVSACDDGSQLKVTAGRVQVLHGKQHC